VNAGDYLVVIGIAVTATFLACAVVYLWGTRGDD
jgi:hypothetical protein